MSRLTKREEAMSDSEWFWRRTVPYYLFMLVQGGLGVYLLYVLFWKLL